MKKIGWFFLYFLSAASVAVGLAFVIYPNFAQPVFPDWNAGRAQAQVFDVEEGPALRIGAHEFGSAPHAKITFSARGDQQITVIEPVTAAFLSSQTPRTEFTLRYAFEDPERVAFRGQHTHWVMENLIWVLAAALTPIIFGVFILAQYIHAKTNYGNDLFDGP